MHSIKDIIILEKKLQEQYSLTGDSGQLPAVAVENIHLSSDLFWLIPSFPNKSSTHRLITNLINHTRPSMIKDIATWNKMSNWRYRFMYRAHYKPYRIYAQSNLITLTFDTHHGSNDSEISVLFKIILCYKISVAQFQGLLGSYDAIVSDIETSHDITKILWGTWMLRYICLVLVHIFILWCFIILDVLGRFPRRLVTLLTQLNVLLKVWVAIITQ